MSGSIKYSVSGKIKKNWIVYHQTDKKKTKIMKIDHHFSGYF